MCIVRFAVLNLTYRAVKTITVRAEVSPANGGSNRVLNFHRAYQPAPTIAS